MKLKNLLKTVKIVALVAKSMTTGKVAKTLDKISDTAQVAEAVRVLVDEVKKK